MLSIKNNPYFMGFLVLVVVLFSIFFIYLLNILDANTFSDFDQGYTPGISPTTYKTPEQIPTPTTQKLADYEVHEWGVIAGCDKNNDWVLTSRPEEVFVVKQPVVYIHSTKYGGKVKNFSARAVFVDGKPTITYPEALVSGSKAEWKDVKIVEAKALPPMGEYKRLVPLESIIPTLNDVEADLLSYNGIEARFLFYEGNLKFQNKVSVNYSLKSKKATVVNNFNYDVYDVTLSVKEDPSFIYGKYFLGSLEVLPAGKSVEIQLQENPNYPDLNVKMQSIGFTEKESEAFQSLWQMPFFYPTNMGTFAKLSYRIPQKEVDKLIKLELDPEPKKKLRTLWVLVDVESNDKDSTGTSRTDCTSDADCAWVSTNCCPENAGAYWECVNPKNIKLNCSDRGQMCLQVISPMPEENCLCMGGTCTSSRTAQVRIKTDKATYEKGEKVKLMAETKGSVYWLPVGPTLQKKFGGEWIQMSQLGYYHDCNSKMSCEEFLTIPLMAPPACSQLNSGLLREWHQQLNMVASPLCDWKGEAQTHREPRCYIKVPASAGTYRYVINYSKGPDCSESLVAESNEFTIKPSQEVVGICENERAIESKIMNSPYCINSEISCSGSRSQSYYYDSRLTKELPQSQGNASESLPESIKKAVVAHKIYDVCSCDSPLEYNIASMHLSQGLKETNCEGYYSLIIDYNSACNGCLKEWKTN
ncbi:MAG: hypothetical protein QXM75_04665 [Candidatus Diapherotrites archaeon]